LYKLSTASQWTTGSTISGNGDIEITGLTPGTYHVIVYSDKSGLMSVPSNLLLAYVTDQTDIEAAIYELLSLDGTIGGIVEGRISPVMLSQTDGIPAITYQQITGLRNHTLSSGTGNMVEATFQVNCYADDYGTGRDLANAVRLCLDSYAGTVNSVVIQKIMMESEGDIISMTDDVQQTRVFGKRLGVRVFFNE
jgi:hypothetical protein